MHERPSGVSVLFFGYFPGPGYQIQLIATDENRLLV